jgi:fructose-1,6-bisphosphatase/inositol monophosphatase family enzyme
VGVISQTIKLWDIAAGVLIAETAGAVVSDNDGNKIFPFEVSGYEGSKFRIVAANSKVHPELIALLQS